MSGWVAVRWRAPWACDAAASRGRRHAEPPAPTRNDFQRDRDRIVHSTAFRRLVYKTQVFLNHEGDLFRTRLTHSLEVAQLGRAMGRELGLDEDLIEAIALAHDLGHTPFGHAGQDALNDCLREHGGFEHNLQSLRVVDTLEQRYAAFDGLNLSFETREGILKHCSAAHARVLEQADPGGVGRRFLENSQPSLEAQLANLADEVAYNAHDIDDGVRSGLLGMDQLAGVPVFAACCEEARADTAGRGPLPVRRLLYESIRRMLSRQVADIIDTSRAALEQHAPFSADAVRRMPSLVAFSPTMQDQSTELKRFLRQQLYRHPQVVATTDLARRVVRDLHAAYTGRPDEMPDDYRRRDDRARAVADYIAGMTDRYAIREHRRLTGERLFDGVGAGVESGSDP